MEAEAVAAEVAAAVVVVAVEEEVEGVEDLVAVAVEAVVAVTKINRNCKHLIISINVLKLSNHCILSPYKC